MIFVTTLTTAITSMPRDYKHVPGTKVYKKHTKAKMEAALRAVKSGMSYRKAAAKFGIPHSVLNRKKLRPNLKKQGGQPVLGTDVEELLVKRVKTCGEWGFPMDSMDLRLIVKGYLDRRGMNIAKFKENMPGKEWAVSFLSE